MDKGMPFPFLLIMILFMQVMISLNTLLHVGSSLVEYAVIVDDLAIKGVLSFFAHWEQEIAEHLKFLFISFQMFFVSSDSRISMNTTFNDLLLLKSSIIQSGAAVYSNRVIDFFLYIQASSNIDYIYLSRVLTPIPGKTIFQYFFPIERGFFMRGAIIWWRKRSKTPGILGAALLRCWFRWKFPIIPATFYSSKMNSLKPLWAPLKTVNCSTLSYLCLLKPKYV